MADDWTSFFIPLLFAQVVGDFVLQTDAVARAKRERKTLALLYHTVAHAVGAYVMLGLPRAWPVAVLLAAAHGLQDSLKERFLSRARPAEAAPGGRGTIFAVDQGLHLLIAAVLAAWLAWREAGTPLWSALAGDAFLRVLVVVTGLIVSVQVGKVLIGMLTAPYAARVRRADPPGDDADTPNDIHVVIGQVERMLVYLLVVTGNMTAVGFVVAAKSVFRFGDIAKAGPRREAEYILVGSLMSFTWAIFIGWLTAYVLAAGLP
ncbi:MAG: DUF3307 domain-containing protein [Planctomycetota bacterium]